MENVSKIDDAYRNLATAIILQAANDYRLVLRGIPLKDQKLANTKKKLLKFFNSAWYRVLSPLDSKVLLQKLEDEYKAEVKNNEVFRRQNKPHRLDF